MKFWQENRFKLKQAFAVAAMCGLTAAGVLTSGASTPLTFLACTAGAYYFNRKGLSDTKEIASIIIADHSFPPDKDNEFLPVVKKLSDKAGIPAPEMKISNHREIGIASAVGEDTLLVDNYSFFHSDRFSGKELEGIVAHEIGHLKNRDVRSGGALHFLMVFNFINALSQTFNALTHKSNSFSMAAVAAVATVGLMAYTFRQQEFEADRMAARLTGSGAPLAKVFEKMNEENPMFSGGPPGPFVRFLSTHPTFPDRIVNLLEEDKRMAAEAARQKATPV